MPPTATHSTLVLGIDDHALVLRELEEKSNLLGAEFVGAPSIVKGLTALEGRRPDLILLDLNLGDGTNPYAAITMFRKRESQARVTVLSGTVDVSSAVRCMRFGAHNVILKGKNPAEIDQEILAVMHGSCEPQPLDELNDRLDETLRAVAVALRDGLTCPQVASKLHCSLRSVYRYVSELRERTDTADFGALVEFLRGSRPIPGAT